MKSKINLLLLISFLVHFKMYSQYPDSVQIRNQKIKKIKVFSSNTLDIFKNEPLNIINYTKSGMIKDSIYSHDNGYPNSLKTWIYNSKTKELDSIIFLKHNSGQWFFDVAYHFKKEYDSNGNLILYSEESGKNLYHDFFKVKNFYDENNKQIARERYCIQDFYYDNEDRIIGIFDRKKKKRKKSKSINYKSYCDRGKSGLPEEMFEYYKDSTVHIKETPHDYDSFIDKEKFVYGSNGNLMTYTFYQTIRINDIEHYLYEYDEKNRLEKISFWKTRDLSSSNIYSTTTIVYDKKDRLAIKSEVNLKYNNGSSEVYEYNDLDLLNKITFFKKFKKIKTYNILYEYFDNKLKDEKPILEQN